MTEQGSMTEQDGMTEQSGMTEPAVGPIDYLALELPAERMKGEGLAALVDLVDRGIIRILDMRAVTREADGTFTAVAITDLDHDGTLDLAIFEGIESCVDALNGLFTGANIGKTLVNVSEPTPA